MANDDLEELGREISGFILEAVRADAGGVVRAELVAALGMALEPTLKAIADTASARQATAEQEVARLRAEVEQMRTSREQLAQDVKTTNRELTGLSREVRQLTALLRRLGVAKPQADEEIGEQGPASSGDLGRWGAPERRPWFGQYARYLIAGAVILVFAGAMFWLSTLLGGGEPDPAKEAQGGAGPTASEVAAPLADEGWARLVADLQSAATTQTPGAKESLSLLCGPLAPGAQCPSLTERLTAEANNARWRDAVARLAAERIAVRNCDAPEGGALAETDGQLTCLLSEAARE